MYIVGIGQRLQPLPFAPPQRFFHPIDAEIFKLACDGELRVTAVELSVQLPPTNLGENVPDFR